MYLGDFAAGGTVLLRFTTKAVTDVPTTLAGTPAVSVYKNSTTQSTAGVTLTVDYDSVTGLNHVLIDTSADGTFYSAGSDFTVVVTTGTVNSVSYVGTVVGAFSIANRPVQSLAAGVITATSIASNAITAAKIADGAIDSATFAADTGLQSVRANTAQAGGSTSVTLDASASATTNFYKGALVLLTGGTGAGQFRVVTAYNGTTKVATVFPAWATNPDNTSTFAIRMEGSVNVEAIEGTASAGAPGYVGIDWAAINAPTTTVGLTGTTMAAGTLTSGERNSVADALLDRANGIEGTITPRQAFRAYLSYCCGKVNGAGTTTVNFRDTGDTKNRIVATVSADGLGNRTAVTTDLT